MDNSYEKATCCKSVIEVGNFMQFSTGAPCPILICDEQSLAMGFYLQKGEGLSPSNDEPDVVSPTTKASIGIVRFKNYLNFKFGSPNDETLEGHPLYKNGLEPYSAFTVENSTWIGDLEKQNSVHERHDPALFKKYKHFILTFHDSTFECVAVNYDVFEKTGRLYTVISDMRDLLDLSPLHSVD